MGINRRTSLERRGRYALGLVPGLRGDGVGGPGQVLGSGAGHGRPARRSTAEPSLVIAREGWTTVPEDQVEGFIPT